MMIGKRNKKFDNLLPDYQQNEYNNPNKNYQNYDENNYESKNKGVRDLYPTSHNYYDPYNGGPKSGYGSIPQYTAPQPEPISTIPPYPVYHPQMPPMYPPQYMQPVYQQPYANPAYEQEYSSPPQRHFIHNTSRKQLQAAQNNYYAKKRGGQGTAFSERSLDNRSEDLNPRQRKRKDRFEDFIKYTAPRLQYKKIILMQALFKGAYVRK